MREMIAGELLVIKRGTQTVVAGPVGFRYRNMTATKTTKAVIAKTNVVGSLRVVQRSVWREPLRTDNRGKQCLEFELGFGQFGAGFRIANDATARKHPSPVAVDPS
jgi:hypothetical protein